VPLFSAGASAAENAPIGIGNTVIVSNTYGYDYDNYTGQHLQPLPGGLTRIDVRDDGSGCETIWRNPALVATVPKLSIRDANIYTVERVVRSSGLQYLSIAIDFRTGKTAAEVPVGGSYALDTHELATTIGLDRTLYQPTINGIIKMHPAAAVP
jgi:hypothetical protein